ncbi:MAG: AmmeMemoRadiSam system protein B [Desulfobacterales bacterium]|nr:AmmeMemoRadiSam system protein B [Desulfobacterales bacterium]
MRQHVSLIVLLALILAFTSLYLPDQNPAMGDTVREPVMAGGFYPAGRAELVALIEQLTQKARATAPPDIPPGRELRAIVMPHAGYIYSGLTAAHASLVLRENQFKKVILAGPDHRVGFKNAAVSAVDYYATPLGRIKLHPDAARIRRESDLFTAVLESDRREHSLEVILPFLQHYLGDFELVPMVLGPLPIKTLAAAVDKILGPDALLVISSDLSHFMTYDQAVSHDRETIDAILNLDLKKLAGRNNAACGRTPLLLVMFLARVYDWKPVLIHYSNSGDTAGDRDRVVGYTLIAFHGGSHMKNKRQKTSQFNEEQGRTLVQLARHTIMEKLGQEPPPAESESLDAALSDEAFTSRRGTFVTLKIGEALRGCIGSLDARDAIRDGVRRNAVNAAFHDPRFPPLTSGEVDRVEIEVSILTDPRPLAFDDAEDLLAKLRPNIDGVILRKGMASATFLPQVWEQLPNTEMFLTHLCMKARLPGDAWRREGMEIQTYQVQYFEED